MGADETKHLAERLSGKSLYRDATFDRASVSVENRTVELSFSSETPVERWFGLEILSHAPDAVNLERLDSGRANLLVNHNSRDWAGVVETAAVEGKRGKATIRFSRSARGEEIMSEVRDGILTSVSVGYMMDEVKLTREVKDGPDEYTITRWTPFEVSLVTVPADASVGVGRGPWMDDQGWRDLAGGMAEPDNVAAAIAKAKTQSADEPANNGGLIMADKPKDPAADAAGGTNDSGASGERLRILTINKLARQHKIDHKTSDAWIADGMNLEAAATAVLEILAERGASNPTTSVAHVGMNPNEVEKYSIFKALRAVVDKNWSKAGLEYAAHKTIADKQPSIVNENTFFIPLEVQQRSFGTKFDGRYGAPMPSTQQRDLSTAAGGGAYLVDTQNMGFIDLLRNRSVLLNLGAMRMSGLIGNVTIPKMSAAATAYWLANEATQITESAQTLIQVALSPKTVGGYTEISRQLMLQSSPDAEGMVMGDLAAITALALDLAGLNGAGSGGEPDGIIGMAGVGSVTGTSLAAGGVLEFQSDIGNALTMGCGYLTTAVNAKLLMQRPELPSTGTTRLWQGNMLDGSLFGFRAMTSGQCPTGDMIFGRWDTCIVGEWGVLSVEANPYANFQAGIIGVRAMYTADIAFRYPEAFSIATSVT